MFWNSFNWNWRFVYNFSCLNTILFTFVYNWIRMNFKTNSKLGQKVFIEVFVGSYVFNDDIDWGTNEECKQNLTLTNNFLFILCLWCAKLMMTWIFLLILTRNSFRWGVVVQKKNPVIKKGKQISINKIIFCLHFKKEITILFGLLTSEKGRFICRLTLH